MPPADRVRLADNQRVAQSLREAADLLESQHANPLRVGAYRKAATGVEFERDVRDLYAERGRVGLESHGSRGGDRGDALYRTLEAA